MRIFTVRRESADGLEVDCFLTEDAAAIWSRHVGVPYGTENTLDGELPALLASCPAYDDE